MRRSLHPSRRSAAPLRALGENSGARAGRAGRAILRVAAVAAGIALAAPAFAEDALPRGASRTGHAVDELFLMANVLAAVSFAAVIAILAWCLVRYRARPGHRAVHATGEDRRSRLYTGIFAAVVFLGLDVSLSIKDHAAFEEMYGDLAELDAGDGAERVEVLAKQFEWAFRYAGPDGAFGTDDDVRSQVLRVPDDRPTILRMRSVDVIHSLFLPHFRTKQDVLPGMTTTMAVRPIAGETGTYEIVCAELCGMAHYRMAGTLEVMNRAAFDAWRAAQDEDVREYGRHTEADEYWDKYRARTAQEAGR
jgi:cytochrome c oxidase subunit 2